MGGFQVSGDVVVYLLGLAAVWGSLLWRVKELEKKMDKHNSFMERVAVSEEKLEQQEGRLVVLEKAHPRAEGGK